MDYIKMLLLLTATALLSTSCTTSKSLKVTGPFKSDVHGDYNDLCRKQGLDPKVIGKGKKIDVVLVDPHGVGREGPYRCSGMQGDAFRGCWLGINYSGDTIYLPRGFNRWVLRHEVYHSVLRHAISKGYDVIVPGTDVTPGHWMKVKLYPGKQVVPAQQIVQTRWPTEWKETLQSLVPGGMTPQQTMKPVTNGWGEILCVSPDWMSR